MKVKAEYTVNLGEAGLTAEEAHVEGLDENGERLLKHASNSLWRLIHG